jgi:hypothetical protein
VAERIGEASEVPGPSSGWTSQRRLQFALRAARMADQSLT